MDNGHQALVDVLSRLASELRETAKETDRLHCLVDGVAWGDVKEKAELMRSAQAIDAIEQKLSGLSEFVAALAEQAPRQWEVAGHLAAARLKLAGLAARLVDRPHADHPAGESEFF
jgi:hypothetical protein